MKIVATWRAHPVTIIRFKARLTHLVGREKRVSHLAGRRARVTEITDTAVLAISGASTRHEAASGTHHALRLPRLLLELALAASNTASLPGCRLALATRARVAGLGVARLQLELARGTFHAHAIAAVSTIARA